MTSFSDPHDLIRLKCHLMAKAKEVKEKREIFTKTEVITAVKQFLTYGEDSFNPHANRNISGHRGYYSECGWAARALRYLYEQLSEGECICDGKK